MIRKSLGYASGLAIAASLSALTPLASAQSFLARRSLVTDKVDESRLTTLPGNVRSAALNPAYDRGAVSPSLAMDHMLLQLRRFPESEAAFAEYISHLNDSNSPLFHQWLSAREQGEKFGPSEEDITRVKGWLEGHGFTVNSVAPNRMVIDFSGTAAQVDEALHADMHNLNVDGEAHIANTHNPQIPTALSGVVEGVVSLHNFRPHAMHKDVAKAHINPHTGTHVEPATSGKVHANYTYNDGEGDTYLALVPGDLATIYNLKPLFAAGYSGQGQTIVVIEDTNVYTTADWSTFRSTFGLSSYTGGSFTQTHPTGSVACLNPGTNSADGEAILDAEWASAAAPSAAIVLASCADTVTTFGGLLALENVVAETNPPKIVSISYGESEVENGASANAAYISAYQSAAAAGISVFVSSGDEGAASTDADKAKATHGISVSGFASTPYNVAVGGTDYGDTVTGTVSSYWNSKNTSTYGSAKSYIPEIPWNDSCASVLLSTAAGYSTPYGSTGFCNSTVGSEYYLSTASGSGGPSNCASGTPKVTTPNLVSGTCKGTPKPSWQSLVGNPSDGVRDIPDVSLFAANGIWGHYFVFCDSDTANDGVACTGAPSNWSGAGGTSFSSPIMAAIQSLVNQKTASSWGNPNPIYYSMAKTEYGTTGNSGCNSSNGNAAGKSCVFYDVTAGDMDVNCTGKTNCYIPSGTNGVLSTSTTSYVPAYGTQTGWDFATGIGSVNAYNLVYQWAGVK